MLRPSSAEYEGEMPGRIRGYRFIDPAFERDVKIPIADLGIKAANYGEDLILPPPEIPCQGFYGNLGLVQRQVTLV